MYEKQVSLDTEQNLNNEVLKIIVNDYVYAEYGFEKEIIYKAINVHNISFDEESETCLSPEFKRIVDKLADYHCFDESFLEI